MTNIMKFFFNSRCYLSTNMLFLLKVRFLMNLIRPIYKYKADQLYQHLVYLSCVVYINHSHKHLLQHFHVLRYQLYLLKIRFLLLFKQVDQSGSSENYSRITEGVSMYYQKVICVLIMNFDRLTMAETEMYLL